MVPPAKRQKRNVLPSSSSASDDDEASGSKAESRLIDLISSSSPSDAQRMASRKTSGQPKTTTNPQTRAKTSNHPHNAAPIYLPKQPRGASKSASTSPEKSKKKGKIEEKVKSGDIFTFFTKQAERQKAEGFNGLTARPKVPSKESNVEDLDLISDGDDVVETKYHSSTVGLAARKRARGMEPLKSGDPNVPSMSQKFFQKPQLSTEVKNEDDLRPWAERFAPNNLDELAVHKKKVTDVRSWLEDVINGRLRQRLLLLKGAAGTGKTTTVKLLAKSMGCDLLEWRNPVGSVAAADGYLSMAAQFEDFMGRGGKFGQLDIFSGNEAAPSKPEAKPLDRRKSIILIEEFPNTFTRSSSALQSFRGAVLQYLAANTPPLSMFHSNTVHDELVTPVVMIVSETLLTTTSASADSFTAHRLLGPEILQHPGVGVIEFNAIAPTYLAKALQLIAQKESRKSGRKKTPGPMVIQKLGEIGDIRSAIGSLEFLCLRGDSDGDWGARVAFGKAKKPKETVALTKMEEESLEMITRREASLGIFHAVGRVVYNKRDDILSSSDVEELPDFLALRARPRKSQVAVDELIDETGTDTQTFIAALHENYILSCDAPATSFDVSTLDHISGCLDALSDSDLLCPSWDGSFAASGFSINRGTGGDILRQDEMTFQIAVRGILFSLPYPVHRKPPPSGAGRAKGFGGDAFKMFYPTSLKLWREKEEIEGQLGMWVARLMRGNEESGITAAAFARSKAGTVESWKSSNSIQNSKAKDDQLIPMLSLGTSARRELLMERLPYMSLISKARKLPDFQGLEKITTFHGIGGPSEESEENEGEEHGVAEEWATDKPEEGRTSPKKRGLVMRGKTSSGALPMMKQETQRLVLSDDDIEDD